MSEISKSSGSTLAEWLRGRDTPLLEQVLMVRTSEPRSVGELADRLQRRSRVRIAPAACVIHSEEPAVVTELATHCKLAELRLRQLPPTVLVSRSPLDKTLAASAGRGLRPGRRDRAHRAGPPPRYRPRLADLRRDTEHRPR
ncbi:hypothetical protein [Streptomyces avermitilis]|uniref:hypothetical protein n=1 Tax=Streptomyces avermitilis TaxID=33903 RepID=UPI0033B4C83C